MDAPPLIADFCICLPLAALRSCLASQRTLPSGMDTPPPPLEYSLHPPPPLPPPAPLKAALDKAIKALDDRRVGEPLGSAAGHLLMSQLDQKGVGAVEEQAEHLIDGGVVVLEKLHLKVSVEGES